MLFQMETASIWPGTNACWPENNNKPAKPCTNTSNAIYSESADFDWSADTQSDIALIYDYEAVWMAD